MSLTAHEHASLRSLAADVATENPRLARAMTRGSGVDPAPGRQRPGAVRCIGGITAMLVAVLLVFVGGAVALSGAIVLDVVATIMLRPYVRGADTRRAR